MATATMSIPLATMPASSASALQVTPATSSQPCGASPSTQPSASSSTQPNASVNNQLVIGTNANSNGAPHAPSTRTIPWAATQKWVVRLLKLFFASAGLLAAYLALSTAIWTSGKDYRDDCRSQNSTLGWITESCRAALSKPLGPPPFLPKGYSGVRVKRWLEDGEGTIATLTRFLLRPWWIPLNIPLLLIVYIGYTLAQARLLTRRDPQSQPEHGNPATWVPYSVPRAELQNTGGNVRRRAVRVVADEDLSSQGDWEAAGVSAAKAEGDAKSKYSSPSDIFGSSFIRMAEPNQYPAPLSSISQEPLVRVRQPLSYSPLSYSFIEAQDLGAKGKQPTVGVKQDLNYRNNSQRGYKGARDDCSKDNLPTKGESQDLDHRSNNQRDNPVARDQFDYPPVVFVEARDHGSNDKLQKVRGNQDSKYGNNILGYNPKAQDLRFQLDPGFKQRTGPRFFIPGRVFAVLWNENMEFWRLWWRSTNNMEGTDTDNVRSEKIFSHIRRMIVVRQGHGYSTCVPIYRYNGQGTTRKIMRKDVIGAHAIVYQVGTRVPEPLNGEELTKHPIALDLVPGERLALESRIHFGRCYTVDWNIKAKEVGFVAADSLKEFRSYWKSEALGTLDPRSLASLSGEDPPWGGMSEENTLSTSMDIAVIDR